MTMVEHQNKRVCSYDDICWSVADERQVWSRCFGYRVGTVGTYQLIVHRISQ